MDLEFHYYLTYILARKAGFAASEAEVVAYASQYTDDNNDKYLVVLPDEEEYQNYISQTLNILRPKNKLVRIYTCFHFPAGDFLDYLPARRADGALHLFNTTPDSTRVREIFQEALASNNLYRLGIAAHCYADSWAHQNFIGFRHAFGRGKGMLARITPTLCHADFRHKPDLINLCWQDRRLLKSALPCRNKQRFLEAAREIFLQLAKYKGQENPARDWEDLQAELSGAIGSECTGVRESLRGCSQRLAAYRRLCPEMPDYDPDIWLSSALTPLASWWRRLGDWLWHRMAALPAVGSFFKAYWPQFLRVRRFRSCFGFNNSHWYGFQEAVKAHQQYALELYADRYAQLGEELREHRV